jgi:hypothetical protein
MNSVHDFPPPMPLTMTRRQAHARFLARPQLLTRI